MCLENLAMSLWSSKHIKPLVNFSWKRVHVIVCSNSATTTVVTKLMNDRLYWFPNKSFQRQSLVFCKCYLWFFCGKILQNLHEWLFIVAIIINNKPTIVNLVCGYNLGYHEMGKKIPSPTIIYESVRNVIPMMMMFNLERLIRV